MVVERYLDYQGRTVDLTKVRWAHITDRHAEMAVHLAEIRAAIETPTKVIRDAKISRVEHFYRPFVGRRMVTAVIIYRPSPAGWVGEIMTAFTTERFAKGEQIWP